MIYQNGQEICYCNILGDGGEKYMATIVNNPPADNSGGPLTAIIVLVVLLVIGYLVWVYGLPALRQSSGTPQINIPSKIDVNVNQTK